MDQQDPPSRRTLIACGALAAAAGGYVILISLGVVPPPGEKNPHAPHWLVFCAGLAFVLAGVALGVRACAGDHAAGGASCRRTHRAGCTRLQYLLVMAIIACFAAIGSFIAFAPGPRSFGISLPFMEMRGGAVDRPHRVRDRRRDPVAVPDRVRGQRRAQAHRPRQGVGQFSCDGV